MNPKRTKKMTSPRSNGTSALLGAGTDSTEQTCSLILNRLRERLDGHHPLPAGERPPEAGIRLEDEVPEAELESFVGWLIDLTGADGHGTPPAEVLRAGSRRKLATLRGLKQELRNAEEVYGALVAALTPLLAGPAPSGRGGVSLQATFPPGTLEGALRCLQTGDRVRNLRIRIGVLSEAIPARVVREARTRGFGNHALRRIAQQARRTVGLA